MNGSNSSVSVGPINPFKLGLLVVGFLVAIWVLFNSFETLNAHQIMCIQSPVKGTLHWYTDAGIKWQGFGKVTKYPKREIYRFEMPVRFNDGGHATLNGSVQFEYPLDKLHLNEIQTKFGSDDAIENQLIKTIVNKSIYMTGPMMSSKESYAEKRTYLVAWIEDQIQNGIFKTTSKETVVKDPLTGVDKTVTIVEVVKNGTGVPERQEESTLDRFGIKAFNFAIEAMPYDATVEKQIQQQQTITMDIQTAMADAKKAEQKAITVEANGKADAAKSKWEQEVIKAKMVTEAEQELAVATLHAKAAEQTKREQILLGEGEGERKRLVMNANGALEQKLGAWLDAQKVWAEAFSKYQGSVVPQFVTGGNGGLNGNAAINFMELMGMKAAKDLSLEMNVPKGR